MADSAASRGDTIGALGGDSDPRTRLYKNRLNIGSYLSRTILPGRLSISSNKEQSKKADEHINA